MRPVVTEDLHGRPLRASRPLMRVKRRSSYEVLGIASTHAGLSGCCIASASSAPRNEPVRDKSASVIIRLLKGSSRLRGRTVCAAAKTCSLVLRCRSPRLISEKIERPSPWRYSRQLASLPWFLRNIIASHDSGVMARTLVWQWSIVPSLFILCWEQHCHWELNAFWDITSYIAIEVNRRFGEICHFHVQGWMVKSSSCFLDAGFFIWIDPWRWRLLYPPKHHLPFSGLHGVISHRMGHFVTKTGRTSNPTNVSMFNF